MNYNNKITHIMGKIFKIALSVFLISLLGLVSCQKDELVDNNLPNPEPPKTDIGKMSAFVTTGYWEANSYNVVLANNILKIEGVGTGNDTISMILNIEPSNHNYYSFYKNQFNCGNLYNRADTIGYSSTRNFDSETASGHIAFSDFDLVNNLLSGSFAYRCSNEGSSKQIPVTEGKFTNLKITIDTSFINTMNVRIVPDSVVCSSVPAYEFNNKINVFGWYSSSKKISITFKNDFAENDSLLIGTSDLDMSLVNNDTEDNAVNGYLKIYDVDSVNNVVKASFDFTTATGVHLKNGNMKVKYFTE